MSTDESKPITAFRVTFMCERCTRHLGAALVAPLGEGGQPKRGAGRIRSVFEVDKDIFLVRGKWNSTLFVMMAMTFVLGFALSRAWAQWAYAPFVVALALYLVARHNLRRVLRNDIAQLVRSGEAVRVDSCRVDKESSVVGRGDLVVESEGRVFEVIVGERAREEIVKAKKASC